MCVCISFLTYRRRHFWAFFSKLNKSLLRLSMPLKFHCLSSIAFRSPPNQPTHTSTVYLFGHCLDATLILASLNPPTLCSYALLPNKLLFTNAVVATTHYLTSGAWLPVLSKITHTPFEPPCYEPLCERLTVNATATAAKSALPD